MRDASDLFFLLGLISIALVVLLIGGYIVMRVYRRGARESGAGSEPFTLQELREMRADGQISEREFESMKAVLIGRATAPKVTDKSTSRRPEADSGDRSTSESPD
jgi:hypothetical protein